MTGTFTGAAGSSVLATVSVTNTATYPVRIVLVGHVRVDSVNTGDAQMYNGVARAAVSTPSGTKFGDSTIDMRPPMINAPSDARDVTITVISAPLLPGQIAWLDVGFTPSLLSPSADGINDPSCAATARGAYSSVRI